MSGISSSNLVINKEPSTGIGFWLQHNQPITDKLISLTGAAQLELCSQQWTSATFWDVYFLNISEKNIFQREILMKSHEQVYWYARTIIPESCYELEPDFFKRLYHESIRNLIFNEHKVTWIQRKIYPINAQCLEYYWVKQYLSPQPDILWARITEFSFQKKGAFYLLEILFPQLEELNSCSGMHTGA